MTKGKPWSPEHEKQLRELVRAGKSIKTISEALGKTETAIRQKMIKLELKEEKKVTQQIFFFYQPLTSRIAKHGKATQGFGCCIGTVADAWA